MQILELKSIGTEMNISFNSRLDKTEEVNELEESAIEIIQSEPQKEENIEEKWTEPQGPVGQCKIF